MKLSRKKNTTTEKKVQRSIFLVFALLILLSYPIAVNAIASNARDQAISAIVNERLEQLLPKIEDSNEKIYLLENKDYELKIEVEIVSITSHSLTYKANGQLAILRVDWQEIFELEKMAMNEQSRTAPEIKAKISSIDTVKAVQYSFPTYWWDGKKFVDAPGPPNFWVKYDHDHNLPGGPYYPEEYNRLYQLTGSSYSHNHIPEWQVYHLGTLTDIWSFASVFITLLIAWGALTGGASVVAALIAGLVLVLAGFAIDYLINTILKTEVDDGWSWTKQTTWYWFWIKMYRIDIRMGSWRTSFPWIIDVPAI